MPQLDPATFPTQLFWLALTFIPLYLILWRSVLPKIASTLEDRQRRLEDDFEKAAALRKEAEMVLAEYQKTRAEAEAKAQSAMREAQEQMAAQASKAHAELSERLGQQVAEAEARIEEAKRTAAASIKQAATEIAASAAGRLIGSDIDPKDCEAAVDAAMKAQS